MLLILEGRVSNIAKIALISLTFLLLLSCQESTNSESVPSKKFLITINLEELIENNIQVDRIEIDFSGHNYQYTEQISNLEFIMQREILLDFHDGEFIDVKADLYYEDKIKTACSKFLLSEEDGFGYIKAEYYHQNVILKFDTNPAFSISEEQFYNFDALDHFFKEYVIANVDDLADDYLETPMKFLLNHSVLTDLLDENNIPVAHYSFGDYYNPVLTCNNAFGAYNEYLRTNDESYLQMFYQNADWLIDYKDDNSLLRYEFDFTHESQTLTVGWTSAMAQGQALAVMSMAYHTSQNEEYLLAADDFFTSMHVNYGSAWNLIIDSEDYLWYEEYPNPDFCHVLNGKLFGMWGLWDYYCLTRNKDALKLFQGGIKSVIDNYPFWDVDGLDGSHYCGHTTEISNYHDIHKRQFSTYRDVLNIQEFDTILKTFTNEQ